ncbi:iron-sulfur cluster co-chaperone protein HscB isoform X1 [Grammomys surdaster]|uniref:iron-sulfur cluster co-chaperone protein HscB isoform X1 n=1 Tax=Grammomys surdaster TaxID=491861 RepID=UPI0010A0B1FA|nr:iron-sulfur cluster co-chaperone protein HscB isoform X1 [Grammomys surdaster]
MWGCRAPALLCVWEVRLAGFLGRRLLSSNAAAGKSIAPQCWNCGRGRGSGCGDEFFCAHCRALQPPDLTRDYFSLMNCNRSFRVDVTKLQRRYQQLQRLVHPDFFSQKSQTEKQFSEKHSTLVNEAYKTLQAPLARGLYLLKLQGIEIPEGTDYKADSQFLVEIMEINERLADAQNEAAMEEIEATVRAKQKEFTDNVNRAFEQGDFERAKELLTKMRFFSNVEEKIKLSKTPL